MADRLTQIEREWFQTRVTGATSTTPLNHLKRTYYVEDIGDAGITSGTRLAELEARWLRKYITDQGDTPSDWDGDLWKQAVVSAGGAPTKYENGNKIIFYLTYTP